MSKSRRNPCSEYGIITVQSRQTFKDFERLIELYRQMPGFRKSANSKSSTNLDDVEQCVKQFLVIRSTGIIEATRDSCATAYATSIGPPRLANRIRTCLRKGLGASPEQLLAFLGSFDPEWQSEFEIYLDDPIQEGSDEPRKSVLGKLVMARKKLAHGGGQSISSANALTWATLSLDISQWIFHRFDPRES